MKKTNQILAVVAFTVLALNSSASSMVSARNSVTCKSFSKKGILPLTVVVMDSKDHAIVGAKVYLQGVNQEYLLTDDMGMVTFYVDGSCPTKLVAVITEDGESINTIVYVNEKNIVSIVE